MARMPSGEPRSVPDPAGDEYDRMVAAQKARAGGEPWYLEHPGLAESLVPVWGSAREAVADAHEGDYVGAAINGGLAVSDAFVAGAVVKGLAKGGLKLAGSNSWKETRRWMGKKGQLQPYQHGHHGIIPQNGWGKIVPDVVKNQQWNVKGMPSPEVHGRIHGPYLGRPQFNVVQRYHYGTPRWAKAATVSTAGRPVEAGRERSQPARGR